MHVKWRNMSISSKIWTKPRSTRLQKFGHYQRHLHYQRHSRAYETRLDADDASGQIPGVPQWTRMDLSGAGRAWEVWGVWRLRLGRLGVTSEHDRSIWTVWTASHRIQLLDTARHCPLERRGRAVCYRTCGSGRIAISPAVGWGWNGAEAGSTHGQFRKPRHAQPNWIGASATLGREVALDSGGRTIWEVLSEEGQHWPQRERFDDETSPRRKVGCLDVFGKTAICQRTRGRSLGGQWGPDRRGECGEENKESTIHWAWRKRLETVGWHIEPGGRERQRAGRLAERCQDQHTSDAPAGRGSVDSAQEAEVPRVAV